MGEGSCPAIAIHCIYTRALPPFLYCFLYCKCVLSPLLCIALVSCHSLHCTGALALFCIAKVPYHSFVLLRCPACHSCIALVPLIPLQVPCAIHCIYTCGLPTTTSALPFTELHWCPTIHSIAPLLGIVEKCNFKINVSVNCEL